MSLLDSVKFNQDGLVAAIAQDHQTGQVLMLAWMNAEALQATLDQHVAVYFSRSRAKLWRKGEQSGHTQIVKSLRLDCDGDAVLMQVEQLGGIACHTGRAHCFYRAPVDGQWVELDAVIKPEGEIYGR